MSVNYDVMVVAGNLLSTSDGLPNSWRDDALNALLFSQLFASSQVDKFDKPEKWYSAHTKAMVQTKWRRTHYRSETFEPDRKSIITLQELIQEHLPGCLSSSQGLSVGDMTSRIAQLPCAEVVQTVFRENVISTVRTGISSPGKAAISTIALQAGFIEQGPITCSVYINFSTSEVVDINLFNQCFSGKDIVGKISVDFSQQELDKLDYEKYNVREKVLSRLSGAQDNLILAVPSNCIQLDCSKCCTSVTCQKHDESTG